MNIKYRPDIDGLRGLQILALIGYHAFPKLIPGGYIGVSIFFVISGYLITLILLKGFNSGSFNFLDFYIKRVRRIFPSLVIILIFSIIVGYFLLPPQEYAQIGKYTLGGFLFIDNFIAWTESGYFDGTAELKPLLHLWSLGIEEQYYLLWPLFLWVIFTRKLSFILAIASVVFISFMMNIETMKWSQSAAFYFPWTRFWEIIFGGILAYFHFKKNDYLGDFFIFSRFKYLGEVISSLGLAIIFFGVFYFNKNSHFPGWLAIIPVLGACLIIFAGPENIINRIILSNRVMVWIGLISYPLYLWHWTLFSFLRNYYGYEPRNLLKITTIFLSFLLSWFTYKFIENPLRFKGGKINVVIVLIVALATCGTIGFYIWDRQGVIPGRESIEKTLFNIEALKDIPRVDKECKSYLGISNPLFPYCRFRNVNSSNTVALIGDSHAHVAFSGVANLLSYKSINTLMLANSGCAPLVGAAYGDTSELKADCSNRINQILDSILSRRDIKKVFIVTLGTYYFNGSHLADAVESNLKREALIHPAKYQESMQKTVNLLKANGKEVFIVAENPEYPFRVSSCLKRPTDFFGESRTCSISRKDVSSRQEEYLRIISSISGAKIINVIDAFCSNEYCTPFHDGVLLYSDGDHLSPAGSEYQANKILKPYLLKGY